MCPPNLVNSQTDKPTNKGEMKYYLRRSAALDIGPVHGGMFY